MTKNRTVEIFSAGCGICLETVSTVQEIACPSCDVSVLDIGDDSVAERAKALGIRSLPAIVIDGKLSDCCSGGGPDAATLRAAGLGQKL